ncbi:MAG: dihydropteroate synthase [Bacteroidaceae bacterium]|nr:dihydropteroate synthase [Bacteroidaceae bacterium]
MGSIRVSLYVFYYICCNLDRTINIKGKLLLTHTPLVMGILNVTPDSFYASSRKNDGDSLLAAAREMLDAGAAILDIGGCSTRPTGEPVPEDEELRRLHAALDVLDAFQPADTVISVDTYRARVARECVRNHNVSIINDVSGFDWDAEMFDTAVELNVPYVLTHSVGWAGDSVEYTSFLPDVLASLSRKVWQLHQAGVKDVIVDPGFGFGKSVQQNYELLTSLPLFEQLEAPLLVGLSRKSMITKVLGNTPVDALAGTVALNMAALERGADILRVHDVKEAAQSVKLFSELKKAQEGLFGRKKNDTYIY